VKAAILYRANTPLGRSTQQQGAQTGEARVRVKAAGARHSDWPAGVTNVSPGDHVIFLPPAVRPLSLLLDRPLDPL
jgi:Zn-dependent alcohol dehydrogenase